MTYRHTRTYIGPVKLIIADLAGTTIDYGSRAPAGAFVELFANHGVHATLDQAREPMGLHKRDHIREMLAMPEIVSQWEKVNGLEPTPEDVEKLFEEFIPMQIAALKKPEYSRLIPGTIEVVEQFRHEGIRFAATTGYNTRMLDMVLETAAEQGYQPDTSTCAAEVYGGRPAPWMIYRCMEATGVYPAAAVVKVGDTIADVEAGLSAGCWSVGFARCGNMLGLSWEDDQALTDEKRDSLLKRARQRLAQAGAHYVVDDINDLPAVVADINRRMKQGEQPC